MIDFETAFGVLSRAGVEFIVVGGTAATIHGSARLTRDLDIVYRRTPENLRRLIAALRPHHPYLRGAQPGLPFRWDEDTLKRGLNFTLTTSLGDIDLLGHVNNVVYFRWFESARIAYFDKVRMWEFGETVGIGPILHSINCRYRIPLTYPDTVSVGARVQPASGYPRS